MGLTGTRQHFVGLTIFKSDESRDSPFQNPSENPALKNASHRLAPGDRIYVAHHRNFYLLHVFAN